VEVENRDDLLKSRVLGEESLWQTASGIEQKVEGSVYDCVLREQVFWVSMKSNGPEYPRELRLAFAPSQACLVRSAGNRARDHSVETGHTLSIPEHRQVPGDDSTVLCEGAPSSLRRADLV
jgi:hypothetical protein